jgi:adenylate cyclase
MSGGTHGGPGGKPTGIEIERKFLITEVPRLDGIVGEKIAQGYIAVDPDGTEVRLRRIGVRLYQTVKTGSGLRRGEFETEITSVQFDAFWPSTEGRRLEKTRYELEWRGHSISLDLYEGSLAGLTVAEVEFESEADSADFERPAWFGIEITDDSAYKNRTLAMRGLPEKPARG